ncbi:MAG: outer membrane lipoprotein-sorting protein [Candidatus Marinimicrobia bacterium]|nr:outer membrane lipoprotein-sorting protein [Candidatus Neomarinimicrobiota bacterium]
MKTNLLLVICIVANFGMIWGGEDSTNSVQLLTNVMKRMENIDLSYVIEMEQSQIGKPDTHRKFLTRVGWSEGNIRQSIRIDYLLPSEMKGVVFWEHRFSDQSRKRWRTLPVTGKLKEFKKSVYKTIKKSGFDFSELELTPQMIEDQNHLVVGLDSLLGREMVIIELQDTTSRPKNRETKRLWIDPERFLIMRVVILDNRDREIKTAECTEVKEIDGKFVYGTVEVHQRKKRQDIVINITDYSFTKIHEPEIFTPTNQ